MHIQLRHLRYFVAVAEELNFRRAAERVFISQPALSVQIAQLEELVGVGLLVRDKRHVELTTEGKVLYADARKILRSLDRAIAKVRNCANIQPLRIGMPDFHFFEIISTSVQKFSTNYPGIELEINEQSALDMQSALLRREIDVGFMTLPLPTDDTKTLKTKVISSEQLLLCLPPSHPAYDSESIDVDSVRGSTFFLAKREHHPGWHDFLVGGFAAAGFELTIRDEVVSAQAQYGLVAANRGTCIALETSPIPSKIRAIPFDPPVFELPLAMVWHTESDHPSIKKLIDSIPELPAKN